MRVLSVDLGVRTSAAISVFRVDKGKPDSGKLFYPISGVDGLVAVHERSVLLRMPGEGGYGRQRSWNAMQEIWKLRTAVKMLNRLLALESAVPSKRTEAIQEIDQVLVDLEQWQGMRVPLWQNRDAPQEEWASAVVTVHRVFETWVGARFRELRSSQSELQIRGGLSIDHVQHLEELRRTLSAWSNHPRRQRQVVRWQRGKEHTIRLGRHITALKRDRVKQLANYIVMTALGYVYDAERSRGEKWVRKYPECQAIVFEDLSRYNFRRDRPRAENRQLMRWTHQEVINTTTMQADAHAVVVGTMYAGFSSRFDAGTRAPGVRGSTVRQILTTRKADGLERIIEDLHLDADILRPGDVLPTGDGEYLLSLTGSSWNPVVKRTHADLNAAHNLQRRLWITDESPYRIRCRKAERDGRAILLPADSLAKRQLGKGFFAIDGNGVYDWNSRGKLTVGQSKDAETDDLDEDSTDLHPDFETLFRDPSEIIANGKWLPAKEFWGRVNAIIAAGVRKNLIGRRTHDHSSEDAQ